MATTDVKEIVRSRYGSIAAKSGSCCGGGADTAISRAIGYTEDELAMAPDGANLGLGCGNPVALASLQEGETVLDLGSGAGFDCFLAAKRVGSSGKVIGVDMTPEMLEKSRANAEKGGYTNVEFRTGEIEALPVDDGTVDVIISNCVINLSPDKPQVFREAFRVLKPGGRIFISDLVVTEELPESVRGWVGAYTACVAGALVKEQYLGAIERAGFEGIEILQETSYPADLLGVSGGSCCAENDALRQLVPAEIPVEDALKAAQSVRSIRVRAVKAR